MDSLCEAHFTDDNPLRPFAYSYPYKQILKSDVLASENWWIFWSDESVFAYIPGTNKRKAPNILDGRTEAGENPYKIKPMVELRKDFPVDQYECIGAIDLIRANKNINIALNNLNLMIHYQAFDQVVISNVNNVDDVSQFKTGTQNPIIIKGQEVNWGLLGYNPKIVECIDAIRSEMQIIAYVYNLQIDWAIDGNPASGFSLLVKNIDLSEAREDDVEIAKLAEKDMYKVISMMQDYHKTYKQLDTEEPKLEVGARIMVDFEESLRLPVQQSEELAMRDWNISHNIETPLDYMDADMDEEQKKEKYRMNKEINGTLSIAEQTRANLENQGVTFE
jgi:hypothetical protein